MKCRVSALPLTLALALIACAQLPSLAGEEARAVDPSPSLDESALQTATAPVAEGATAGPTGTADQPQGLPTYPGASLSPNGPWLVYLDRNSLQITATNQDGSGRTELDLPPPVSANSEITGAPGGNLLAYISGDESAERPQLEMILVELPSGQIADRLPLIEPDWHEKALPADVEDERLYLADVLQSIREQGSFAWDPSGRYLAYVGATVGPSGDVYVYDSQSQRSLQLTSGAGQAALLSWSPNSEWIAHLAVRTFCCGAGWNVRGLWVADPSRTAVEEVISGGGMFFVEKWLNDESFIQTTWTAANDYQELWTVSIPESDRIRFFSAPLRMHAYDTGGSVVALYLEEMGAQDFGVAPGLYLQPRYGGPPIPVMPGVEPRSIEYSEAADRFVAGLEGETVLFSRQGEMEGGIPTGGFVAVSPAGDWIAIYGDGQEGEAGIRAYSFEQAQLQTLTERPVQDLFWSPDSEGVFVTLEGGDLGYLALDGREVVLVDGTSSFQVVHKTWVGR